MSRTFNMVRGSGPKATLSVTVTNGTATSVTATKDGSSISLIQTGGTWLAELPSFGAWTVTITDGTHSNSATVNATQAGLYSVSIYMPDVPIGYTQLEWVESSGATIDTGYQPVSSCRLYGKFKPIQAATYNYPIWAQSGNKYIGFEFSPTDGINYFNGIKSGSSFPYVTAASFNQNTIYEFSTSGRTITMNGTSRTVTIGPSITSAFANLSFGSPIRMYYFKMSAPDATTLVRDMVPAKRQSDAKVGMWDKVNNVFYTSSNSNTFTAGPEVN